MTVIAESTADIAYMRIRQLITDHSYDSGARLKEEELAELVGASRTPVRAALARLQSEGLITMLKNRGAFVTEFSTDDAREIFELRKRLEPYTARLAATRCDETALDRLEELASSMESLVLADPDSIEQMAVLNNQFHDCIALASRSSRAHDMVKGLVSATLVLRTFAGYNELSWQRSLNHHRELIDALRSRDPEWAEAIMTTHIASGENRHLGTRDTMKER